jgi:hypothetical protein
MRTSVVSSMSRSFSRISRSTSTECRSLQSSLARRASKRNDALCSPVGICSSATLISPGESVAAIGARPCVRARSCSPTRGSTRVRGAQAPTSFGPSTREGARSNGIGA